MGADKKKHIDGNVPGGGVVIQLGQGGDALDMTTAEIPSVSPVLPVRNMVIFPGAPTPLAIGREKSKQLLDDLLPEQKILVVVCQKRAEVDDPAPKDLFTTGTAVSVLRMLRLEDGTQSVILRGLRRVHIEEWTAQEPYLRARVTPLTDHIADSTETEALMVNVQTMARKVIMLSPGVPDEAVLILDNIENPGELADFLAANMEMPLADKQQLLAELDVNIRLRILSGALQHQVDVLELSGKIQEQVKANIGESQREYFLQEQLKAIQEELGQLDDRTVEVEHMRERIEAAHMADDINEECLRELSRMERIPAASPEYNVIRTYLDWMTELPWSVSTADDLDVNRAERTLNKDHYDLEQVKRRVLEYLAVRKLAPDSRGPILCFVGPPGVGKTSLGQSIARALGRKFIRMSLGGMRDEAELRGHRRTYIGAMPGRIIQEIRKAGTNNPVFMLDELDKVGADFRGDPTSALLEILDPAQNFSFQDHYLNVAFDLSKVMFIGTANYIQPVPPALRDRMEVIELPGYTRREKLFIATKYLIGRQLKDNGLKATQAKWQDPAVDLIIRSYTREAGVRELERQIGSVCRGIAAKVAAGKTRGRTVTPALVKELLGPRKYESELALRTSEPGVATGLAYTPTGGEILFIEATSYPGTGQLILTGQIGDVMRESAQAALSLIKSRGDSLGIDVEAMAKLDIHVHVPAGGVPKDGPSAGVSIFTALTSLLTGRPVRADVAMTGEITLRGLILPIGGMKEKALAARRAGVSTIVLPKRNEKDLPGVPDDVKKELTFEFVANVSQLLEIVLTPPEGANRSRRKKKNKKND